MVVSYKTASHVSCKLLLDALVLCIAFQFTIV